MDAYMDSLERVIAGNYDILWPTHGGPVTDPLPFLEALKAHRLERDRLGNIIDESDTSEGAGKEEDKWLELGFDFPDAP